jgi:hypothetical protein
MLSDVIKSKNPVVKYASYAMIAAIIIVVIIVISKIISASKTAGAAAGDAAGAAITAAQTGVSSERQLICKQVAKDVRNAMTLLIFTNTVIGVDSKAFAAALNRLVTPEEAQLTSEYFREANGFGIADTANNLGYYTSIFGATPTINPIILNSLN